MKLQIPELLDIQGRQAFALAVRIENKSVPQVKSTNLVDIFTHIYKPEQLLHWLFATQS